MGNSVKEELQPVDGIEVIGGMTFAEKLDKYLLETGRKPADIARAAGVAPSQISKYRSGTTKPAISALLRISRTTGIALEYWLDDEMDQPPQLETTPDEARVLWVVRALRLDAEEVLRRIERAGSMPESEKPSGDQKPEVTQTSTGGSSPKRGAR
jgi:transcriptional regulator with XRE-family HTH domain